MTSHMATGRRFRRSRLPAAILLLLAALAVEVAAGEATGTPQEGSRNCVRVEVFVRGDSDRGRACIEFVRDLGRRRPGLAVEVRDVLTDREALARVRRILAFYKVEQPGLPVVHAAQQVVVGFRDARSTGAEIEDLMTVHAYVREGCPKCADAKVFLADVPRQYPGFKVRFHEITTEPGAREELHELARRYRVAATSVPAFHLCGELVVGYFGERTTGRRIAELLQKSSVPCPRPVSQARPAGAGRWRLVAMVGPPGQPVAAEDDRKGEVLGTPADSRQRPDESPDHLDELPVDELPLDELPGQDATALDEPPDDDETSSGTRQVDLPVFGPVSVRSVGLPLFTLAVGLVDGFNPCAMWVLLFLLSILVNLRDRRRILAVAGTFVLVSGLAYYAFMAAWLNVFVLVGYLRPAQVVLGLLAVFVGLVHVKDFFAFHRGLTLSIPESAKPGLYARVRKIVTAPHLAGAVLGALVLALLVNVIELLCTAGLPALYTQILALQELPAWQNYAYLGLYNAAYMFDDALMVAVVVVTLGKTRLQERGGRWLKLLSGLVILALGLLLLLKPEWLA